MSRARRTTLIFALVLTLAGLGLYLGGAPTLSTSPLSHGYGYANCPIGIDFDAPDAALKGFSFPVFGQLIPETGADVAGETITIRRIPEGSSTETTITTVTTDSDGFFDANISLSGSAFVLARWTGGGSCAFTYTSGANVIVYSFADVTPNHFAWESVEAIFAEGITAGCATNPPLYCPNASTTRGQMAVFLLRGMGHGSPSHLPAYRGIFADVPSSHPFARYIEHLYDHGVTAGCATSPRRYCPSDPVSRGQMAVFILRAIGHGSLSHLPAFRGIFADVSSSNSFARYIEHLYDHGVTAGCATSPRRYCPTRSVTRAEMAVFLARAFGL